MDSKDALSAMQELEKLGWTRVYVWTDLPGATRPDHTRDADTAHVVLTGELTVTTAAEGTRTYAPGDRFDIAEGEAHSVAAGPEGCVCVIGEKRDG